MGRTVSKPTNTLLVTYKDVTDLQDSNDWVMFTEDIFFQLEQMFPSVVVSDKWLGREDKAIAENELVYFGISEYCGLASIWIALKNEEKEHLAQHWVDKIAEKFIDTFGDLVKIGTFSNGEAIYERKTL